MPHDVASWSIRGADGEAIVGNTHRPAGEAIGVAILVHGFKGYKDYGLFPPLARAMARHGLMVHRFNFSHSGMTNNIETFEREDLFERDTWNKQVFDLRAVIDAMNSGVIDGRDLPYVLFGHSRGGVSVLLTAGRYADDGSFPQPWGVITAAAPSRCNSMSEEDQETLLRQGWIVSPSGRTGQQLKVGKAFLQEQIEDPASHDLLGLASKIRCPVLIVHGEEDETVSVEHAGTLSKALGERANVRIVEGGTHVFNAPNPYPEGEEPSPQLAELIDVATRFARSVCEQSG